MNKCNFLNSQNNAFLIVFLFASCLIWWLVGCQLTSGNMGMGWDRSHSSRIGKEQEYSSESMVRQEWKATPMSLSKENDGK